jgi:hypothetical protein
MITSNLKNFDELVVLVLQCQEIRDLAAFQPRQT